MRGRTGLILLLALNAFVFTKAAQLQLDGTEPGTICTYACNADRTCFGGGSRVCPVDCNKACGFSGSSSSGNGGSSGGSKCNYKCQSSGGCEVTYGQTLGSCFPATFGGSCSGTPRECQDCNRAISCSGGGSSSGSSGGSGSNSRPSGGSGSNSRPSGGSGSGGSKSDRNCKYECQGNGGCQVTYIGTFRPGQTQGSCFPASFGGSCSGTPRECQDCNRALNC